jgi:protein gp37
MSKTTTIEWTADASGNPGATWNPWMGCRKVSPGCANCYAERDMTRYGRNFNVVTRTKDPTFFAPLKWKEPKRIFTCSWSDWFIEEADAWRPEAYNVIDATRQHEYLILTKRIERVTKNEFFLWPKNIWLGVSVETPRQFGRIDKLREINAGIRFLSMEPLLSGSFHDLNLTGIHWVITGTESGSNARPVDLEWIRRLRDKCKKAEVPFFLKQLTTMGGIKIPFESWPEDLRIREFPSGKI